MDFVKNVGDEASRSFAIGQLRLVHVSVAEVLISRGLSEATATPDLEQASKEGGQVVFREKS